MRGQYVKYAAISLVPVLVLGMVLAGAYRSEARRRGLAESRSEAALVARAGVEPLLEGHALSTGLTTAERAGLRRLVVRTVGEGSLVRLRVRDLAGRVVFSEDGSGLNGPADDESLEAAGGAVVAKLTSLNADANDSGPRGAAVVEVYRQLKAGAPSRPVGVLELYLPYAPIAQDVTAGLHTLYRDLALGLGLLYLALLAISVSVSRRLRRQLAVNAFLAEHDALTDLPNRALFRSRAETAVVAATHDQRQVAIAIIDLDRFKEVNDTLGHHNGDHLLQKLAERLAVNTRAEDTVARLGGDEFGVVLRDDADPATTLARLRELIEHEVEVSGLPLSVEASVGYVVAPDDGTDVDELLQRADVAMYVAKQQHAGVVRYDPKHDHYDAAKLSLIAELRHAIDAGQLVLHYQPKTNLSDGSVEAVEALVRWQHPVQGLLPPGRFLPLVEQTDLIDKLTEWVLATALTEIRDLDPSGALAVAVNVSARNLGDDAFPASVADILERVGVPAHRLIIEITETALLIDPLRASAALAELGGLGHDLALTVVGEGVETDEVLDTLKAAGCDVAQGFVLARPMPVGDLEGWLLDSQPRPKAPKPRARRRTPRAPSRRKGVQDLVHGPVR